MVASDPQVAQVNPMRHQRTELPQSKSKWKQQSHKSKSKKRYSSEHKDERPPFKKVFDLSQAHNGRDRFSKCGDSKHIEGFKCLLGSFSARHAVNMAILQACAAKHNYLLNQEIPRHINCKW